MKLVILVIIVFGVLVDSYWFDLRLGVPVSITKSQAHHGYWPSPMLFTTIGQFIRLETAMPAGIDVYTPIHLWLPSWWF